MTPRQIELVQSSFAQVAPLADQAAALFYGRLFTLDPALRKLFRGDMTQQGAKLMQMIGAAVRGLHDLPKLVPVLGGLGARHRGYGVKPRDYDSVAQALMWTLEQGLQSAFTPEVRAAWEVFYGVAACTMLEAAEPPLLGPSLPLDHRLGHAAAWRLGGRLAPQRRSPMTAFTLLLLLLASVSVVGAAFWVFLGVVPHVPFR